MGEIHDDTILKDKYGININHLDNKSVLQLASLFHIFANQAYLGNSADVNGNIAVGALRGNDEFGTEGGSVQLSKGDIYYIQRLIDGLGHDSFKNEEFNHVVFGSKVDVKVVDGKVFVNGREMPNLKPDEVFKDSENTFYIDFASVFKRLVKASDFYASQRTSEGVVENYSNINDRYIDVSKAKPTDNVVYVNIDARHLNVHRPINIYGLSSDKNAPTVVINLVGADSLRIVRSKINLYYDGKDTPLEDGEDHDVPNRLLWNFGPQEQRIHFVEEGFMGSVLAPNVTVSVHEGLDGNIVANVVNIFDADTNRWDIYPVVPESAVDPDNPDKPDPDNPDKPDPDNPDKPDPDNPDKPDPDPQPGQDSDPDPDPKPTTDPESPVTPEDPKGSETTDTETPAPSQPEQSQPQETGTNELPKAESTEFTEPADQKEVKTEETPQASAENTAVSKNEAVSEKPQAEFTVEPVAEPVAKTAVQSGKPQVTPAEAKTTGARQEEIGQAKAQAGNTQSAGKPVENTGLPQTGAS